jgi:excinuclease ABC subunit A
MKQTIKISGARVNNLKDISIEIPKNKLTVITGLSGSGKSSLAFDTIYAEGQRRYAESLSAYARQFMEVQDKPDVDEIIGLSPTIAIDQKNSSRNPRSTLGTTTEIYDLLRLLFARIGKQYCPETYELAHSFTAGEISEHVRKEAREHELQIFATFIDGYIKSKKSLLLSLEASGFNMIRVNGTLIKLSDFKKFDIDTSKEYHIDILIAEISDPKKQPINNYIETALDLSNGSMLVVNLDTDKEYTMTTYPYCKTSEKTFDPIEPRSFSFNSPYGACPRCTGLGYTLDIEPDLIIPNPKLTLAEGAIQPWMRIMGNSSIQQKLLEAVAKAHKFSIHIPVKDMSKKILNIILYGTDGKQYIISGKKMQFDGIIPNLIQKHTSTESEFMKKELEQYMQERICPICEGKRLKKESLFVRIDEYSISDTTQINLLEAKKLFSIPKKNTKKETSLLSKLNKNDQSVALPIIKEINKRIENLINVGLHYLTLNRAVNTLSGGEMQRTRLSNQLATGLTDVIYVLDEPSIGLHPKDNQKLIDTLKELRDIGNTVIVVEHDQTIMEQADLLVDIGPGAGKNGGEIMAQGTYTEVLKNKNSLTGQYLSGEEIIEIPKKLRKGNKKSITIMGATAHNLKNIDVKIPLGKFICVTGVSGSGKSTLINHILGRALSKHFYRAKMKVGEHKKIKGIEHIDKVISIDQAPIGRTPRSNPATYTGVFTNIRDLFASQTEARMRGYDAGKFSFNVKGGGRCETCAGEGYIRIPMHFLNDVFVECNSCSGKRYNKEALEIHYRGKNISDILEMTIDEAFVFFRGTSNIADKLKILREVGLGYLHLGQAATNLSGGEAQRIKLATELSRRQTGKTLYILDEPTTGLHFSDIKRLLGILGKLVEKGNTVLTIEHNMDVIKCADWIIDMGPSGGKEGGDVMVEGTPKDIAACKKSFTGQYLKHII